MSGEPFFSVLIATHNQAGYILATLDSVAAQTFRDYEIVIVDDGSTDDTAERVHEWIERHRETGPAQVRLETIANSGQSGAMEHGFGLCRGRYIALLDSDDLWLPGKLEQVHDAAVRTPDAGMIVHPLYVVDAEGRRTGDVRPMRAKLSEGDLREQIRRTARQIAPATSGVVIRADVFRQLVPMATKGFRSAADSYLTMGASLLAPVRAVHEPLGEYRMHPNSMYLRRTTSAEGLRYTVDLQRTIARHFGVEEAVERNAYFARHTFALAMFEGGIGSQVGSYLRLVRATLADPSYRPRDKVLFSGYWTVCLLSPRRAFGKLWRFFQLRHTGTHRVGATESP